ncbi:MAG: homocysteine S-methyltransferase family protein [Planctomycetota bacterium]|jgi:5-methyltetrahydrofolate--homocysteine methyltransferase
MGVVLDALKEKKILISDGAWGTMLQAAGMTSEDCPEEWNVSHAGEVQAVAKAYQDAGSDIILSDTFGGSSIKLKKMGFGDKVEEFNAAGIKNSIEGAPNVIVAGSVGPTGEFIEPLGTMTEAEMEAVFTEQIEGMIKGGATAICVETMTAVEEAACAVRAAKKLDPDMDVIVTFTFDPSPNGYKTMMGVSPARVVEELVEAGADVVGSNCGNGIENMIEITKEFRAASADVPILIHANAGLPELVDGETVFRQTPADMASKAKELIDAGANIIGGCCGSTPGHITAMKEVADTLR